MSLLAKSDTHTAYFTFCSSFFPSSAARPNGESLFYSSLQSNYLQSLGHRERERERTALSEAADNERTGNSSRSCCCDINLTERDRAYMTSFSFRQQRSFTARH